MDLGGVTCWHYFLVNYSFPESCHPSKVTRFVTIVAVQRPKPEPVLTDRMQPELLHRSTGWMDTLLFFKK